MDYKKEYQDCLSYIASYWDKITFQPATELNNHAIEIPHTYITPNDKKFNYIFYWDSFFMFRGLMCTEREWVMRDMVNNFCFLFDTYGFIPNFNSQASMGRSQPPFFSSMIFDVYNNLVVAQNNQDTHPKELSYLYKPMLPETWLTIMIERAKKEYTHVWLDNERDHHHRIDDSLLSRYGDLDVGYAHSSELESGWDFTSRFYNRCNEFLPIDLNTYLYKYENDFLRAAKILGDSREEGIWEKAMEERRNEINRLMWYEKKGFFFDYDYKLKKQSEFLSLAGFTPLWAGLPSPEQAKKMVLRLPSFETDHGLLITAIESLMPQTSLTGIPESYRVAVEYVLKPKQWDYPHIWPPLEYLTVIGLLRYGFVDDAKRIMEKSVKTHAKLFRTYGTFFEKIDGVLGDKSKDFHYQVQAGFGWTNAIFYRYIEILTAIATKQSIYHGQQQTPPFAFAIPH